jgi:serine/threonine-protein kinase
VLRPDSATRDALDRFRREADILKQISSTNPSPFIVRFFDHGEAEFPLAISTREFAQLPFTLMEYVHGEPLNSVLEKLRGHGLPVKTVRRILREIRAALEIVHAQGLIHRDLKPSNILIAQEAGREVAKVTDFGLAKVIDIRATSTQSLAGVSLSYAPPEQYEPGNPRVGPPTDVFSYGTIIYEMLCGLPAYPASSANPFEALRRIATGNRVRLSERPDIVSPGLRERPDLVQRVDALLDKLLAPEPQNRPQTIGVVFEHIDALLREADGGRIEVSGLMASAPTRPGTPELHVPNPGFNSRSMGSDPLSIPPVPQLVVPTRASAFPPARDPSDLRAWSFRLITPGNPGALVRDATFSGDLREILTLGNAGLVQWSPSGWSAVPLPIGLSPLEVRALAHIGNGVHAVAGDNGVVAILQNGSWEVRRYPDPDISFHGIAASPSGQVMFAVGARTSRGTAVMVELAAGGFRRTFEVPDQGPLRSIAYLDERTSFACGDAGALVRVDDAGLTRIGWERSGHLRMIVAGQSGVFAVGSGGHALSVGARTEIEKVNTTQDLLGVALAPDGAAWACSANARLLRRDVTHAWRRMPVDLPIQTNLVRVAPRLDRVMLVSEDAAVIEGTLG